MNVSSAIKSRIAIYEILSAPKGGRNFSWVVHVIKRPRRVVGGMRFGRTHPKKKGDFRTGANLQLRFSETTTLNFGYEARVNLESCSHQLDLGMQTKF